MEKINVSMKVNGKNETLSVEPRTLLVHALREHLEYTGAHVGCSSSHCGACTVDMNGKSVKKTIFEKNKCYLTSLCQKTIICDSF